MPTELQELEEAISNSSISDETVMRLFHLVIRYQDKESRDRVLNLLRKHRPGLAARIDIWF